jgi:hypothetical protein
MSANSGYITGGFAGDMRVALELSLGTSASSDRSAAQALQTGGAAWNGRKIQAFIPVTPFDKALSARLNEVLESSLPDVLTSLVVGYLSHAEILERLVPEATNDPQVAQYVVPDLAFHGNKDMVVHTIRTVAQDAAFQNDPVGYMQKWNAERENAKPKGYIDAPRSYITKFLQRNGILPAPPRVARSNIIDIEVDGIFW